MLYVRMLFIMAVNLYISRAILQVLGVEDFGIYNVVGGVVVMFSFLNNAMTAAVQRYISFELGRGGNDRLHTVFCMSVSIQALLALIIFLLAEGAGMYVIYEYLKIPGDRLFAAIMVFQFSLLSFIITVLQVPYMSCIIAHEKMGVYALGSIFDCLAKLLGICLLASLPGDKLILYSGILFVICAITTLFYRVYANSRFGECKYERIWDKGLFREMLSYSGWSLFGGIATVLSQQGINILLNIFFGPAVNAARGIAYQVNAAVSSLYSSFTQALNPQIIKQYSGGNIPYMHQLILRSCRFTYLLVLLLACPILIGTDEILRVWLGIVPENAPLFCRLVLISTLLDCISMPFVPSINATGKIKTYQMLVGGVLIMSLPVSYVVLRITSRPEHCFYVLIVIALMTTCARLWMCHVVLSLSLKRFYSDVICKILPATIISVVPILVMPDIHVMVRIIIEAVVVLAAVWTMAIDSEERGVMMKILKRYV